METVSTTVRGYDTEELHFPMKQAYLVQDTFEVDGTLRTQDASYLPEIVFNFQIGDESKLQYTSPRKWRPLKLNGART